jgi:DNA polymerase elongation subunit (family B)/predicted RNA-binding Zn-ribbon protein involved in translation (DUF1610 family)
MPKIKRLFFDIETSPNIGLFWEPGYNISLNHENIVQERAIICICFKWAGEKKVHYLQWDKNQCDKEMLKNFIKIMDMADEVVAHNGNRFDIKWLRTRCLFHEIDMMPNYTSIDTCSLAKRRFKFNSNALDYIGRFLGVGKKNETTFGLWKKVLLENDKKSLKQMIDYCKQDVRLLEQVWDRMNNYVMPTTNIASNIHHCPECGSANVHIKKRRVTAGGYRKIQFQCQDCGKYNTVAESRYYKGKAI